MNFKRIAILFFLILNTLFGYSMGEELAHDENENIPRIHEGRDSSLEMLTSIIELENTLKKRIAAKTEILNDSSSETEKEAILQEIKKLDKQLDEVSFDFEKIATGVDIALFSEKKVESFNWKNEVLSLVEPGIKELKLLTLKARQKTKVKEEIGHYEKLIPIADNAIENIGKLMAEASDKTLKTNLELLLPEWKSIKEQFENKQKIAKMRLFQMDNEAKSMVESSRIFIRDFFKTRGFYLFLALFACIAVVVLFRLLYLSVKKVVPVFKLESRPFYIRMIELGFKLATVIFSLFAMIFVFYTAEDWVLLSLTIVFFLGLGWTVKNALPRLWHQSRLILNVGAVREGERIVYNDIPWLVKNINVFTRLYNPSLDMELRLPIEALLDQVSRPVGAHEPWFPCRKNDWVILSDGIRGKVTSLSNEMVELVQRGGARKFYQTMDFLGLSPLNLSTGFRLKVTFGVGYDHQRDAVDLIPEAIEHHVRNQLEAENYLNNLVNLRVEFEQAGASSLDLVVIADFDGGVADLYNRLKRAIQRWCVSACTENEWEIPFPQLTVHRK